jgi:hypothetical protein
MLVPLLIMILARRHLRWRDLDPGCHTRWLIGTVAGILVWTFTTYDVNLYYDQSHVLDRLLLVGLWVAVLFHPMAIAPLLVVMMAIATQGHYPLPEGPWMWPDKRLPLDILILFTAYALLAAGLRKRIRPNLLPFLLLCMVGGTYAHAAINKVLLGPNVLTWVFDNDLSNLVVSSHVHGGWLRGIGHEGVLSYAGFVGGFGVLLSAGTLLAEGAGLLILVHWKLTRFILVGFAALHLGILATSGIFFWKWIAADIALLIYFVLLRRDAADSDDEAVRERPKVFFRPALLALGLAVIIFSPRYFNNVSFAWFDTRLTNHFEIYGIGDSGARYRIDPRFFAPYDIIIQQSRHYYAAPAPVIAGTYGTTSRWDLVEALDAATPETLGEVRRRFGRLQLSPPLANRLFRLVHRYLSNAERRGGRRSALSWLAPPFHFQSTAADNSFDFQEPLAAVEIRFVEHLHGRGSIDRTLDLKVVRFDMRPSAPLSDQ